MKAFIAYNKGEDTGSSTTIQKRLDTIGALGVTSEQYFTERFMDCGGWNGWIEDVYGGVDFMSRAPNFDICICTSMVIGRATSEIVKGFQKLGKPIWFYDVFIDDFTNVTGVTVRDDENWQEGWYLTLDK